MFSGSTRCFASDLSKPVHAPSHKEWWDVEDGCFVDADLHPLPLLEQDALAFTPAQHQLYSRHHSTGRPLQDQSNLYTDNGTRQSIPEEAALQKDGGGDSEGSIFPPKRDMELAFGE